MSWPRPRRSGRDAADQAPAGTGPAGGLRAAWDEYRTRYVEFSRLADERELRQEYFQDLQPAFLRLKAATAKILEINQDAMLSKSDQARATAERNRSLLLLATIAALGLSLLASVSLTRRALQPLQRLSL